MTLTILPADGDLREQWREVHNRVIAPTQLTAEDVAERAVRNSLTVGYRTAPSSKTQPSALPVPIAVKWDSPS